jgi:hypothetical protein
MKKQYLNTIGSIILLLCLSLLLLFPLLKPGFIVTDDGDWMVIRLTAFYQAFADGQFPVRFLSRLNNNYGYPIANFLYPGFLYIGSLLRIFKLPYTLIIEVILGGSVIVSGVFLFLWLKKFFSGFPSFIGACSLLVSPYFLYDLYKRGSVGELMGTGAAIVLLWCIESGFVGLIPPITALLLVSHNTLAFLFSLFLMGYVIVRRKYNTILPLAIGVWITSFFWIPAIFERSFVRFDTVQVANPLDYIPISQTLLLMSVPFFVPFLLFFRKKKDRFDKEFLFFSTIVAFAAIGSSIIGVVFWKLSFFVRFVQFPYRLLSVVFIAGPWLLAFFITQCRDKRKTWIGLILLAVLFATNIPLLLNVKSVVREEGFYTTNEGTTTVQDEYMPRWVKDKPEERANEKLVLFSGKGTICNIKSSTKRIDAELKLEDESIMQFNTVFYPGWGAILDGKPVELFYQNPKGVIQVVVPKGDHIISFEFRETGFRYIADLLSSIGVLLYGMYIVFLLSKRVKRKS